MTSPGFEFMTRVGQIKEIIKYSNSRYPYEYVSLALDTVQNLDEMRSAPANPSDWLPPFTDAQLNTGFGIMSAHLNVIMPVTPIDNAGLAVLTDAEILQLAKDHELAAWDYDARKTALARTNTYFATRMKYTPVTPPSATDYEAKFLFFANTVRSARGLPNLT